MSWLQAVQGVTSGIDALTNVASFVNGLYRQNVEDERYIEERDYQRALQERIFEREDSAIQRRVQDASAAGLTALSVAGDGASSGAVVGQSARRSADSVAPTQLFQTARGLQELMIQQDANERENALAQAEIQFKKDSLALNRDNMMMNFQLQNAKMFNEYQLAAEDLKLKNKEWKLKDLRLQADITNLNRQHEQWMKQYLSQGEQFQASLDYQKWNSIWNNINGSINAGTNLIGEFNPLNVFKNLFKGK